MALLASIAGARANELGHLLTPTTVENRRRRAPLVVFHNPFFYQFGRQEAAQKQPPGRGRKRAAEEAGPSGLKSEATAAWRSALPGARR